jgi:murein DD-endopeptidase MepM/ murein hydrolase activator NlpD
LLNASVGVQRALDRLRPVPGQRSSKAQVIHRQSLALARGVRALVLPERMHDGTDERTRTGTHLVPAAASAPAEATHHQTVTPEPARRKVGRSAIAPRSVAADSARVVAPARIARRSLVSRIGADRAVPAAAIAILLVASAVSSAPALSQSGPVGGTIGDGHEARIIAGGVASAVGGPDGSINDSPLEGLGIIAGIQNDGSTGGDQDPAAQDAAVGGTLDDGTLLKPVAVDTTVADGKGLMRTYRVRSGDTLTGIARKFDVTMMTVWWANHLRAKDDLHIGQILTIPPVSGVVVTVGASDTLETLAATYDIDPSEIIGANQLNDPHLVIGQTLTIPGGHGAAIATPKPKPAAKPATKSSTSSSHGSSQPPSRYTGGKFAWPVDGGYISQYFHYGHYAIDIAAPYGTRVKAAAAGTVIFAGWKSNGGGYQVWISHGSNLYTTYNHMSSISVGRGQHVSRGQQVGRIGQSGNATGPHLHFEVWRGPVWNGGTRVNPLLYL